MTRYIGCSELSLLERLLNKIKIDMITDCWEFQGGKNNLGYGMIRDGKSMRTAHRVSYEEHNNTSIPANLVVMHSCDNPSCVNPAHLSIGTRKQNTIDMFNKGRHRPFGWVPGAPGLRTGVKLPKVICEHCKRLVATNAYVRYHGDKCKHKTVSINRI
jgi:hypothetical protein